MNRREKSLVWLFTLVMLLFSLGMALWVPLRARLDFQLADIRLSLETSRGRERKQQAEYDMVMEELPRVRAELAEEQPRAEAAAEEVKALKEIRKALREKKKAMEKEIREKKETDHEAAASPDRPVGESENP